MTTPTPREAADGLEFLAEDARSILSPLAQRHMRVLLDHARATDPAAGGDLVARIEQLGNRLGADGIVSRRTANEVREALHGLVDDLRAATPASEAATEGGDDLIDYYLRGAVKWIRAVPDGVMGPHWSVPAQLAERVERVADAIRARRVGATGTTEGDT